jgi:2-desacetyl-2-hydroxyethyl bacteriochlorophyllide A dehydrogenase
LPTGGLGYQNVGRVTEVGPEVKDLKHGDVLYMSVEHAEYSVVPEDGLLLKLPESVDRTHAALFGVSAVAMHTCRNAELKVGERVLVVGAGCVGQMAAQIAAVMGARVTLCDVDSNRLEIAQQVASIEATLDVSGDGWESGIADETFDTVLDLAGVPGMEDQLIGSVRRRGKVFFIAGRDKVTYTFNLGQRREIVIKQNSHFTRDDLENLCRFVSQGLVDIELLIRDVVPVNEAKRIYDTLRDTPQELLGTVFVW